MQRPSLITLIAITLVGILVALVLLPGIAGLLEGDYGFLSEQLDQGWNHTNNVTLPQALGDVYAWSFWRIGLRSAPPDDYEIYKHIQLIRTRINPTRWRSYPVLPTLPKSMLPVVTEPEPMN